MSRYNINVSEQLYKRLIPRRGKLSIEEKRHVSFDYVISMMLNQIEMMEKKMEEKRKKKEEKNKK